MFSNHKEPVYAPLEWYRNMKGKRLCPKCNSFIRDNYPVPYDIVLGSKPAPGHRLMGYVTHAACSIYHVDFILQIWQYLQMYGYILGKCYTENGKMISEYMTIYHRSYIVRRGKEVSYKICEKCKSVTYYPMWGENQYLTKNETKNMLILQGKSGGLYLEESLFKKINFALWSDLEYQVIRVHDQNSDVNAFPDTTSYWHFFQEKPKKLL